MSKVLMVYASMTGNTEVAADLVEEGLKAEGIEVFKKEVTDAAAFDMVGYDGVLLGAYTWGDGDLPDEFEDFFDEMDEVDLTGINVAIFGTGDTTYPEFCGAVDTLENKAKEKGGNIVVEGLKVEMCPIGEDEENCKEFGRTVAKAVKGISV